MTIQKKLADSDLNGIWKRVTREFPFEGYINAARKSGYLEMVRRVAKWSGTDCSVLDFGAGPCDKTALFALAGMKVTAFDDLQDAWHVLGDNRQKILTFAKSVGIDYHVSSPEDPFPFPPGPYDVVMSHDVLEHLHSSPRVICNHLLGFLRPGGLLAITVPNAGNLRKRISLMLGRTNYPNFPYYYWYTGQWRGHVREYVKGDLEMLSSFLGLEVLEVAGYSLQLDVLPRLLRAPFQFASSAAPSLRDSWMLVARKPLDWEPRFAPSAPERGEAFGAQYFDYSNVELDWMS